MRKITTFLFLMLIVIDAFAINLDFSNSALISCNQEDNDIGKRCIYNVAPGIYAEVYVSAKTNNATLEQFDTTDYGEDKAFQPVVSIDGKGEGNFFFIVTFWDSPSKTNPVYLDEVKVTAVDIDGDGSQEKESILFLDFISYTVESTTNIDDIRSTSNLFISYKFSPSTYDNQPGINYEQNPPDNMVTVLYRKVHTIKFATYVYNNAETTSSGRLFSIYFSDTYNSNPFPQYQNPQTTQVGVVVEGKVVEDINGDGDISDGQGKNNVRFYIYQDDGDGTPNSSDLFVSSRVTGKYNGNDGFFACALLKDKTYWLVINSKTIRKSSYNRGYNINHIWAEQTYGGVHVLCDDDANPNTPPVEKNSAGVCFGGAYGNRSDNYSSLSEAEHIAKIQTSNTDISGIDFGFSFNVVTNVNDQDDDTNNPRTCQGCLRQFIQNANAIAGANSMRFVPAVPTNKTNYWSIQTDHTMTDTDPFSTDNNNPIFRITDTDTTIDGIAYDYRDGTTVLDTNTGIVDGKTVGYLQTCSISGFEKPELEIFTTLRNPNDSDEDSVWNPYSNNGATIFYVTKDNFTLKNLSAYGGHYVVFIDRSNNPTITDNLLGIPASGVSDPGDGKRSNRGVVIASTDGDVIQVSGSIKHNVTGYTRLHGIFVYNIDGNNSFLIEENKVVYPSKGWEHENGIGAESGSKNIVIQCNYITNSCGVGIETWKSDGYHTIKGNTVENVGLSSCAENPGNPEKIGIRLTSSNNTVKYNLVTGSRGAGILVAYNSGRGFNPVSNFISQNSIYGNGGLAIDLLKDGGDIALGDGVTPNNGQTDTDIGNNGIDYPVFTGTFLRGDTLHIEGYIGTATNKLKPPSGKTWKIEIYKADDDGNNNGEIEEGDGKSVPHGEGKDYIATVSLTDTDFDNENNFSKDITVSGLSVGDTITAIVIDENSNTSEFGANTTVEAGNKIYGYVYHDGYNYQTQEYVKPNKSKDSFEKWVDKNSPAPTVYVKLCDLDGNVLQIQEIKDGNGYYQFTNLQNGTYLVVEDIDNDTANCEASNPEGWISTTSDVETVELENTSVQINFGDFHGSVIRGYVFLDNGNGTISNANNGLKDEGEKVIQGVIVKACLDKSCSTVIDKSITNGEGIYEIFIPVDYDEQNLYIVEIDKTGFTSTGNTRGNMSTYKGAEDPLKDRNIIDYINNSSGNISENYNFGDVKKINIQPSQSYLVPAGGSLSINHTVNINTPGKVAILLASQENWQYTIFEDKNCDGTPEGTLTKLNGYYYLNGGNTLETGIRCIVIKTVVPTNTPPQTIEKLSVLAYEDWENTDSSIFDDTEDIDDTITVSSENGGMLSLEKFVKNVSQNGEFVKQNEGKPCEILEYKIVFKNIGSTKIKNLSINDNIPLGTEFLSGQYNGQDVSVNFMGSTYEGSVSDNPDTDGVELKYNALNVKIDMLTGKTDIEPGEEGYLLYRVRIKGNCE